MNRHVCWGALLLSACFTPGGLPSGFPPRAIAHTIQSTGNVGATFHIEPNDTPRAGEPSVAWFALTQPGGKLIPLTLCDCQLHVFQQTITGSNPSNQPILSPALEVITTDRYEAIPGAKMIFPEAGTYQLVLEGRPRSTATFDAFRLTYTVNVLPRTVTAIPAPPTAAVLEPDELAPDELTAETAPSNPVVAQNDSATSPPWWNWVIALGGLGVIAGIFVWQKQRANHSGQTHTK